MIAGLGIGLKLLLGAMFPPAKPETPKVPREAYNFAGARNQMAPFDPIPVVLGKHRVTPFYGALPYTEDVGDDQYLRALFVVGYGALDITDIRIGETPISEFEDVEYEVKEGYSSDTDADAVSAPGHRGAGQHHAGGTSRRHRRPSTSAMTRVTASTINKIGINFFYPQGLIKYDTEGKKNAINSVVKIRYRPYPAGGAWTSVTDIDIRQEDRQPDPRRPHLGGDQRAAIRGRGLSRVDQDTTIRPRRRSASMMSCGRRSRGFGRARRSPTISRWR